MSADLKFDYRQLNAGIDAALRDTKKTLPGILNKASLTTIIGSSTVRGCIQRTPRADPGKIAGVPIEKVAGFVANRLRKKGISISYGGGKNRTTIKHAAGSTITAQEFRRAVSQEYARRKRSVAYTAGPGWDKAARAFGGRGVTRQSGFERSEAAKGYGDKATVSDLVAEIANTAPAADKIGRQALQDALNDVGRDMQQHALEKEFAAALKKNSA